MSLARRRRARFSAICSLVVQQSHTQLPVSAHITSGPVAGLSRERASGGVNCKSSRIFAIGLSADRQTKGKAAGEPGGLMKDAPILAKGNSPPSYFLVFRVASILKERPTVPSSRQRATAAGGAAARTVMLGPDNQDPGAHLTAGPCGSASLLRYPGLCRGLKYTRCTSSAVARTMRTGDRAPPLRERPTVFLQIARGTKTLTARPYECR